MGGFDAVDLSFSDIRMVIQGKRGDKVVLDGSIKGRARPGRMLAIMGPSGAGKDVDNGRYPQLEILSVRSLIHSFDPPPLSQGSRVYCMLWQVGSRRAQNYTWKDSDSSMANP